MSIEEANRQSMEIGVEQKGSNRALESREGHDTKVWDFWLHEEAGSYFSTVDYRACKADSTVQCLRRNIEAQRQIGHTITEIAHIPDIPHEPRP